MSKLKRTLPKSDGATSVWVKPGSRRAALLVCVMAFAGLAATAALADTVPPPAPKPTITPPPSQDSAVVPGKMTPAQKEAMVGINQYFNTIRTLTGSFVQFGPDGQQTEGDLYLSKPGKIHFIYAKPASLEIISNGTDVVVFDRKNQTQDLYPLSQTPLKFLLADQLDLTAEANVTKVSIEPDLITVVVEQQSLAGNGQLALVFGRKTFELKQWTVKDAQGLETSVALYGLAENVTVDDQQFKIEQLAPKSDKRR